ncbi:hypothetical protein [Limnochorda pilosa]|nr:hypothetical protein [Limnochorda pilosa]
MHRQVSTVPAATAPQPDAPSAGGAVWRRARGYAIQAVLVTSLIGLLAGAGGRLAMPPGLFDRAIDAFEASDARLTRYQLGAGAALTAPGPGFVGLERVVARAWGAAGRDGQAPRVRAGQEGDLLSLTWEGGDAVQGWRVTALRENGAPSTFVWLGVEGASAAGLRRQAERLLRAARTLAPSSQVSLHVHLEGSYDEAMGRAAREALAASLARVAGEGSPLSIRLASSAEGARLVIETTGLPAAYLPLPTYSQVR